MLHLIQESLQTKRNNEDNSQNKIIKENNENGDVLTTQKDYEYFYRGKDWESLMSKHDLRYDIWIILSLYEELNVSQISKKVKQSKSTVSRVLRDMEIDGLLVFRRQTVNRDEQEKIRPKIYRINEKYRTSEGKEKTFMGIPSDPEELYDFLLSEISNHRNAIYNIVRIVNYLSSALNVIDDQLKFENIEKAKSLYNTYISGTNEPEFNILFLDKQRFKKFYDIRLEFMLKIKNLLLEKELDAKSVFVYFDSFLPLKTLLDFNKEEEV